MVRKKDETARVCHNYRGLIKLLQSDNEGLGDIQNNFDGINGASCFTSIDLPSGFTQLEIAQKDKHKSRISGCPRYTMGTNPVRVWAENVTSRLCSLRWWSFRFMTRKGSPKLVG